MTQRALVTYLTARPAGYRVDSAYEISERFRVVEQTARTCLESAGFVLEEGRWVKQETQLDRVEQKLDRLLATIPRRPTNRYPETPDIIAVLHAEV